MRAMLFVDGENLVCRFQEMMSGEKPRQKHIATEHIPDTFVWNPQISLPDNNWDVIRSNYYTSVVGDDDAVRKVEETIKKVRSAQNAPAAFRHLTPIVHKKGKNSRKTTTIDIRLSVDALSQVYLHNVEVLCLFSGDADFEPLVREVQSRGVRVVIGAVSSGLSRNLRLMSDAFINLDNSFFTPH